MANIASQKKRILRTERERTENRLLTSTVKTYFRRLEAAVATEKKAVERARRPLCIGSSDVPGVSKLYLTRYSPPPETWPT